jgi:hypothetical protein
MKTPNVLFLLGSGASPAPKVSELTSLILNASMERHSSGRWIPMDGCPADPGSLSSIIPLFLRRLAQLVAEWQHRSIDKVFYEDIAAVCQNLWKEYGTSRNPLIAPALVQLTAEFGDRAIRAFPFADALSRSEAFDRLVVEYLQWIRWTTVHALSKPTSSNTGSLVAFFSGLLPHLESWSIATLNHDLNIEHALAQLQIPFSDGFPGTNAVRDFSPRSFQSGNGLLKLHGGIDWRWHPSRNRWVRIVDSSGLDAQESPEEPMILVGTYTKLEDYNYAIFPKLISAFDQALERADWVVVCGYGFKDPGINSRLILEFSFEPRKELLVIHPEPKSLLQEADYSAARFLQSFRPDNLFLPERFDGAATESGLSILKQRLGLVQA